MSRTRRLKIIAFFSISFLLSACASPSREMTAKSGEDDSVFTRVFKDPESYAGSIVLWGGKIIETMNYPNGTEILVLETPLDYRGLPESAKYPRWRFIARTSKSLNPETYPQGKWITVEGKILGKGIRPLGKESYVYPVVEIRDVRIWSGARAPATYKWPSYGYDPLHGPYEGGWLGSGWQPDEWGNMEME
jgi:outer membrane lipoprotein